MSKLLIKFPTRGRPAVFKETFRKYYNFANKKNDLEFLVTMDADDKTMNRDDMDKFFRSFDCLVTYCYGNCSSKVQAINANMENANFDILLLASDDMVPVEQGYDEIIVENMQKHFPDLDGVLHFNDGRAGSQLNTLSIMGKPMYDRFGYIYHPDYISLWCDNEFHDVTYGLKKAAYIDKIIIHHGWTDVTGNDRLATRNNSFYERDQIMYRARQKAGFPKESIPLPPQLNKRSKIDHRSAHRRRRP